MRSGRSGLLGGVVVNCSKPLVEEYLIVALRALRRAWKLHSLATALLPSASVEGIEACLA